MDNGTCHKIRWVTMSHSYSETEVKNFVNNMNTALQNRPIRFELIKTTAPTLGKLLFNNNNKNNTTDYTNTCKSTCKICSSDSKGNEKKAVSKATGATYNIDNNSLCCNSGIYLITCKCEEQYVGKTTVSFRKRFTEHGSKNTSVKEHLNICTTKPTTDDITIQFVENVWNRGKFSLSEREFLWNRRFKGSINVQKTLKNY